MGLRMIPAKLDAILRGDLSGRIVNPIFIHIAHLVGCLWYQSDAEEQVDPALEDSYYHTVLECLADEDHLAPLDNIQSCALVGTYFFLKLRFDDGWGMGRKANDVIVRYNLCITVPDQEAIVSLRARSTAYGAYGHLKALDEADEERSALCNLLYLDKGSDMLVSMPVASEQRLDEEFRALAVRMYGSSVMRNRLNPYHVVFPVSVP